MHIQPSQEHKPRGDDEMTKCNRGRRDAQWYLCRNDQQAHMWVEFTKLDGGMTRLSWVYDLDDALIVDERMLPSRVVDEIEEATEAATMFSHKRTEMEETIAAFRANQAANDRAWAQAQIDGLTAVLESIPDDDRDEDAA